VAKKRRSIEILLLKLNQNLLLRKTAAFIESYKSQNRIGTVFEDGVQPNFTI
jgi:hypothetical protein